MCVAKLAQNEMKNQTKKVCATHEQMIRIIDAWRKRY